MNSYLALLTETIGAKIYQRDLPHFVSVTTPSINITKSSSRLHSATAQIQNDPDRLVAGRMASSMVASCSLLSNRTPRAIGTSNAAMFRALLPLTIYVMYLWHSL